MEFILRALSAVLQVNDGILSAAKTPITATTARALGQDVYIPSVPISCSVIPIPSRLQYFARLDRGHSRCQS